ncbi:shikimate dehydrogenase [Neomoorella thermoacetica]|uniref:shikimate dehydrogenase n=1 Tax=Neomoorella thermoacetica TaxID=1525 RepID=UPI0008FBA63B|nr:shikimate dehydrogenase [Moorella thermoacetica]OIQ60227.1 shikimate dehydrogenase [Moorella thermoacetica]
MIQVKASTGLVALLGHPVQHSLSPLMHNAAFAAGGQNLVYLAFDVEQGDLVAALAGLKALGFRGANVTVPHKEAVIPYLDAVDPVAARIGAVNTIVNEDRCLKGYNTDGSGFLRSLEEAGFHPAGKRAVILGAGGAARAVAFALATAGCGSLVLANRTPERATELAGALAGAGLPAPVVYRLGDAGMRSEVEAADLVLNTTSLGMWPRVEETPLPPDWFRPGQWVYDLVYNPLETKFLASARRRGCRVISGLDMLLYQGAAAFTLWTGREAPVAVMARVLREAMGASSGGPAAGR